MFACIYRCLQRRLQALIVARLIQLPFAAMAAAFGSFNRNNLYASSVFLLIVKACVFPSSFSVAALASENAPLTCTHEGLELKPGQFASTATDKCRLCYCDSHGVMQCKPLKNCPRPTWFDSYDYVGDCLPVFAEGDCCPLDYVCECRQAIKNQPTTNSTTKKCSDCACNSYGASRCKTANTTTDCQQSRKMASLLSPSSESSSSFANSSSRTVAANNEQNSVHSESSSLSPLAAAAAGGGQSHDVKLLLDDGRQLLFQRQRPLEVVLVDSYSLPVVMNTNTHLLNSNNTASFLSSSSLLMRSYLLQHPETLLPGILVEQALAALRDSTVNTIYVVIAGANSTSLSPLLTGPAIELLAESAVEKALVEMLTKSASFAARIRTALGSASSSSPNTVNTSKLGSVSSSGGMLVAEGSSFVNKFARRSATTATTTSALPAATTPNQQVAVVHPNKTHVQVKVTTPVINNTNTNETAKSTPIVAALKHPVGRGSTVVSSVSGRTKQKSANLMAPVSPLLQSVTYVEATADNSTSKRVENHNKDFVLLGPTASPIEQITNHYDIIEGGTRRGGASPVSKRFNTVGGPLQQHNHNGRIHQQHHSGGGGYASSHAQRAAGGGGQQQPAPQVLKKNHSSALISPLLPTLLGAAAAGGDMLEKATSLASMQVAAAGGLGGLGGAGGGGGNALASAMQSFMGAALGGAGGVLGSPAAVSLAGMPAFGGGGGAGGALGAVLNAAAAASGGGGAAGQQPLLTEEVMELMVDTMGSLGAASVIATALSSPAAQQQPPPAAPPVVVNSYDPGFSSGTGNAIGGPGGMLQAMPRSGSGQAHTANHQNSVGQNNNNNNNNNNAVANGGPMRVVESAPYNPMQAPFSQHPSLSLYNNNNNNNQSPSRNRRANPRNAMNAWRRGSGYVEAAEMATTTKAGMASSTMKPSPASPMAAPSSSSSFNQNKNNNGGGGYSARSGSNHHNNKRRAFGPITLQHNYNSNAATAAAMAAAAGPRPRNAPLAEGERTFGLVKIANMSDATTTYTTGYYTARATPKPKQQTNSLSHKVTNKKKAVVKTVVSSFSAKNKSQAFIDGSGSAAFAAYYSTPPSTSAPSSTTTTSSPPVSPPADVANSEAPTELLAMASTAVQHEVVAPAPGEPMIPNPNEISAAMISVSTEPNAFDTALDAMLGGGGSTSSPSLGGGGGNNGQHQSPGSSASHGGHEVNANDQWTLVNSPAANEPLPVSDQAIVTTANSDPGFVEPISPHKTTTPATDPTPSGGGGANVDANTVAATGGNAAAASDPFNDPIYLTSLLNTRAALINQAAAIGQQTGGNGMMLNANEGQTGGPKISLTGHKIPSMHFATNGGGGTSGGLGTSASFIFPGTTNPLASMLAPGSSAAVMMQMAKGGAAAGAEALGAQLSSMLNAHLVNTGDPMTVAAINAGRSPVNADAVTDAIEEPIDNPRMHSALFGQNGLVSQANNARIMRVVGGGGGGGMQQPGIDGGAHYTTRGSPSTTMGGLGGILQPESGRANNANPFGGAPLHTNMPSLLASLGGMMNGGGHQQQRANAVAQQQNFNAMANAAAMTSLMENMFLEPQMPSDKAIAAFQNEMMNSMGLGGAAGGGGGAGAAPVFEGDHKGGPMGGGGMMNPMMLMSLMNGVGGGGGGGAARLTAAGGGGGGMAGGVGGLPLGLNPFGPMPFAEMRVAASSSASTSGGGDRAEAAAAAAPAKNSISATALGPPLGITAAALRQPARPVVPIRPGSIESIAAAAAAAAARGQTLYTVPAYAGGVAAVAPAVGGRGAGTKEPSGQEGGT